MTIRFTILRCLIGAPSDAATLERALVSLRHFYPLEHVNVHPVLNDLEHEGLIRSEARVSDGLADRTYAITDVGRVAFARWQSAPPEDASSQARDLVHLRLALATDRPEDLEWLAWVIPEAEEEAARARRIYGRNRCNLTPVAQLAVEEMIAGLERRAGFLRRALELARAEESTERKALASAACA